jgi:hypothetical protein
MDKQTEYEIRKHVYNLNNKRVEEEINKLIESELIDFTKYELIVYSLLSIENGFKESTFLGDSTHESAGVKRVFLEWYLKQLLIEQTIIENFEFNQSKYDKFESNLSEKFMLCGEYLLNKQFGQMRGINKILIEENIENEYFFKMPKLKEDIDCQTTYYWSDNIDPFQGEKEIQIKNHALEIIINKYYSKQNPNEDDFEKINRFIFLDEIDREVYEACKLSIKVDVEKMGVAFSSDIFKNMQQLIDVIGVFLYISKTNTFKDTMLDLRGNLQHKIPIIYSRTELITIIQKFISITYDEINNIISYFVINSNLVGGINEYPLVNAVNNILWVPSAFIMNDFQFSIVNGHYEKGIKIKNRDNTISQSVVNNIINGCNKYKNIVVANNREYFDKLHKFNGGDLKSDVDVALYDEISNSLLIIECKWKENVFLKGERYDQICDAVDHIYNKQLDKHKYFLELEEKNLDFIFDNDQRVRKRLYYPQVLYIFVDKRIQLHYERKHALSEFNLLKIFKENSSNGILRLDKVNSYISTLSTEVEYSKKNLVSIIQLGDKLIKNNLFRLI